MEKKSSRHKPEQIALQQLHTNEQAVCTGDIGKHEKITLICLRLIWQAQAKTALFLGAALCWHM